MERNGGGAPSLLERFRGSMVGALVGDCLGANFECQHEGLVPQPLLDSFFAELESESELYRYTDDTAMALQIAASFVENRRFSYPDLAQRFSQEYFREPWRGYGGSVVEVFTKLKKNPSEPFLPASQQFKGSGSYGNGAGMRAHPVALACHGQPPALVAETAVSVARITHAHRHGVGGGLLQTLAVGQALVAESPAAVLRSLQSAMASYEAELEEASRDYTHKLQLVEEALDKPDEDLGEIVFELGNDVSALESVPTALFCFLRGCRNFQPEQQFEETIRLAISLGGDTDTIASMAGAITGAYLGIQAIPDRMQRRCESLADVLELADKIHAIISPPFTISLSPEKQLATTPDTTVAIAAEKQLAVTPDTTVAIPPEKQVAVPADRTVAVPLENTSLAAVGSSPPEKKSRIDADEKTTPG